MHYHPQFPYANFPIWVVSATAFAFDDSIANFVYSVQLRVMGMLIDTQSVGRNLLKVSKLVCAVCMLPFPMRLDGTTRTELKCRTSRRVPSLMNPFRGDTHPSPTGLEPVQVKVGNEDLRHEDLRQGHRLLHSHVVPNAFHALGPDPVPLH